MKVRYVARVYRINEVPDPAQGETDDTIQESTINTLDTDDHFLFEVQGDRKEEICSQIMRRSDTGPGHTDDSAGNSDNG